MNLLMNPRSPADFYGCKWLQFRSRDARGINRASSTGIRDRAGGIDRSSPS